MHKATRRTSFFVHSLKDSSDSIAAPNNESRRAGTKSFGRCSDSSCKMNRSEACGGLRRSLPNAIKL